MTPLIDSLRTARASQTGKILDAKTLALLLAEIDGLVGVKDAPAQPLTVELGKCYRTRDGRKAGPMRETGWPELLAGNIKDGPVGEIWNISDGTAGDRDSEDPVIPNEANLDLVSEWVEPADAEPATAAPYVFGPKAVINDLKGKWEQTGPNTYRGHLTPIPDYNDGEIHIWRGGECPVHELSNVRAWFIDKSVEECQARCLSWLHENDDADCNIIAFQVTRPHVEPVVEPAPLLECWINVESDGSAFGFDSKEQATASVGVNAIRTAVHMREVTE